MFFLFFLRCDANVPLPSHTIYWHKGCEDFTVIAPAPINKAKQGFHCAQKGVFKSDKVNLVFLLSTVPPKAWNGICANTNEGKEEEKSSLTINMPLNFL